MVDKVKELLRNSEARTGNRITFIVGNSGNKVRHVLISVLDSNLEVDLHDDLTPAKEKLILDWFEPLAKAHQSALGA
jgi:hypothetical protein